MFFINYYLLLLIISPFWHRVSENAIGCAIGSAVAIVFSIFIYWLTNRHNNLAAEREKSDEELNQLKAFKLMLQGAIKTSDKRIEFLHSFIPDLKKYPVEFPLLQTTSLGNLKRIIDTITVEKTGMAYMKHFPDENSAKEFTTILEVIDFLYAAFDELTEVIKRASYNHADRLVKISDVFDVADKILIDSIEHLNSDHHLTKKIVEIKNNFTKNRGDVSDIHAVNNLYFAPMKDLMFEALDNNVINEFVRKFTYSVSKGVEYYSYMISGYDRFAIEMEDYEKSLEENLPKLKIPAQRILQSRLIS